METIYWKIDKQHLMVYSESKDKAKIKYDPIAIYTHTGHKRPFAFQWFVEVDSKAQSDIFKTLKIKKKNYVKA